MHAAAPSPRRLALPLVLGLAGAAALLLAGAGRAAEPASVVTVPTLTLAATAPGHQLWLEGSVQALRQATVAAQTAGNVLERPVKAGDRVRAGQLLARIDARAAEAGLAQVDAALRQAEAAARLALTERDRTRELRAEGFVSQAALDQAETRQRAADAALAQAQAARSGAALARGYTAVIAPFDGVVLETQVEAGDLAAPGRPILTLYAPGAMRAVVQVPASLAAAARAAQAVSVEGPDGRAITPLRRSELPGADPVAQTVEWRLDLPAEAGELRPGQGVRVRFDGAAAAAAPAAAGRTLSVPRSALLRRGELQAVYVAQDGRFVLRSVRSGAARGERVELLAGVQAGERIAVDAVRAGLAAARPAN